MEAWKVAITFHASIPLFLPIVADRIFVKG